MDTNLTDLTDRLTATAATPGREAAAWLLIQHGHWVPELDRAGLIQSTDDTAVVSWSLVASECLRMGSNPQIIGTLSEWQVLRVACMLTGRHSLSLLDLSSLDEQNVRLVLHAIAWAARGQTWADQQFTPPASAQITPELASHVLWHFNQGGMRPGSFTQQLLLTFASADPMHADRLREAYPAHGWAMHLAQNTEQGIAQLRVIAGERPPIRSHAAGCSHPGHASAGSCSPS